MQITHYDLFAGIGGFSYALDTIFNNHEIKHIFCEWEAFPTAVLKKHWPDATYYGDIADLVADTERARRAGQSRQAEGQHRLCDRSREDENTQVRFTSNTYSQRDSHGLGEIQEAYGEVPQRDNDAKLSNSNRSNELTILTGGFPCQPFSHAGRRQGTSDDRYKWPEMFAVIRNVRPDWVIAENVRGLVTWNDGMVLETVCADLEAEGYEVQPIVIPAVAVSAPHRRDRVWIIAHSIDGRQRREEQGSDGASDSIPEEYRTQDSATRKSERTTSDRYDHRPWNLDWREVALATCHDQVDDGLPRRMGDATISGAKYRKEALKAYGNAIVPQVAMEIFTAIRQTL